MMGYTYTKDERNQRILNGEASFRTVRRWCYKNWEYKCSVCDISDYNGKPLSLQLDHKDGDNKNHLLENLRWLCPNCHSQTDNWGVKNISKDGRKRMLEGAKKGNATAQANMEIVAKEKNIEDQDLILNFG